MQGGPGGVCRYERERREEGWTRKGREEKRLPGSKDALPPQHKAGWSTCPWQLPRATGAPSLTEIN